jgi:hypothetical protein
MNLIITQGPLLRLLRLVEQEVNTKFYFETFMESGIFGGLFSIKKEVRKDQGLMGNLLLRDTAANMNTHQSLNKLPVLPLNRQYIIHSKKFKNNST